MKPSTHITVRGRRIRRLAALAAALACASPAFAELGGAPTLGPSDTGPGAAAAAGLQVRQITRADGGVEREYLGADGVVVAVAWRGRFAPALSALMGTRYLTQMTQQARALREQGLGSHHMTSQSGPTFAVNATATQRLWSGVAWLPPLLPAGVDARSLSIKKGA